MNALKMNMCLTSFGVQTVDYILPGLQALSIQAFSTFQGLHDILKIKRDCCDLTFSIY